MDCFIKWQKTFQRSLSSAHKKRTLLGPFSFFKWRLARDPNQRSYVLHDSDAHEQSHEPG